MNDYNAMVFIYAVALATREGTSFKTTIPEAIAAVDFMLHHLNQTKEQ